MSTEKPLEPTDLFVVVDEHAQKWLHQYRELEQQWLAAPSGTAESKALGAQLEPLRLKLVVWLNLAVARAEDAAAKGE